MRWLLDTNVWIDAMANEPMASSALMVAALDEWCGHSAMTRLELLSHPSLSAQDLADWRLLLAQSEEVTIGDTVIEEAARLRRTVRLKAPDAIIAATALLQNATLVTRNIADFRRVPGLMVMSPVEL